jgi:hypothetical protein
MKHLDASGGSLLADILPIRGLASREHVVVVVSGPRFDYDTHSRRMRDGM